MPHGNSEVKNQKHRAQAGSKDFECRPMTISQNGSIVAYSKLRSEWIEEDRMSVSAVSALSAQTNYPILVNGFLCYSSADVMAARSGSKPEKSTDSTSATQATAQTESTSVTAQARAAIAGTQTADAVGSTSQTASKDETKDPTRRGAVVDLYA